MGREPLKVPIKRKESITILQGEGEKKKLVTKRGP